MSRALTPATTLESLKKEAKRWLKALRAHDGPARARLLGVLPGASADPGLRDIQHALALEHGLVGWTALKKALDDSAATRAGHVELDRWFLENACPDHQIRGGPPHVMALHTAERILRRTPDLARHSLYTAVVCGDLDEVTRLLTERPQAAVNKGGPKGWEPLLYLCFTRLPLPAARDNAVAIARALLDRGADPNVYFLAGGSRYTPLVGVVGEGEEDRPPHPQREALTQLLLDRGADPFDIQVIYNTHFRGDVRWFLELIHAHSVKSGRHAAWDDPNWSMLDMGGYGGGARFLLHQAVKKNDLELAEWILTHGASPNPAPAPGRNQSTRSLHEEAVRIAGTEMADLLVRYGATPSAVAIEGEEAFAAACLRGDREKAKAILDQHPELSRSPAVMFAAAERDRADVVALLLDLGLSPDLEDGHGQRALHVAAYSDAPRVAALLLEKGASVDPVDAMHGGTPLWFATWGRKLRTIELLSRVSRDLRALSFTGNVDRLRELLSVEPSLATQAGAESTPLMWLPDDEARAMEIARLLLGHGADPSRRTAEGQTASDLAARRGLLDVAEVLRSASSAADRLSLTRYERLAEDLLEAYRTGNPAAMQRVWEAAGHRRNWEAMRTYVQLDLGKRPDSAGQDVEISLDDARFIVARGHGFESWRALAAYVTSLPPETATVAAKPVMLVRVDETGTEQIVSRSRDWDHVIGVMKEQQIPGLNADGEMTDALLERISRLDHVTSLNLAGSRRLTDEGLRYLARLPRLQHLILGGQQITDRGLVVLRELRQLKTVSLSWTSVTDAGVANLSPCGQLERVVLGWTRTGDGAIEALAGKPRLGHFHAGHHVTATGVALLREFPVFKSWQGGEVRMALTSPEASPNFLMLPLKAPLMNQALANLAGLDGLFGLNLDCESTLTSDAISPLAGLLHLGWLGCAGGKIDDDAMRQIAGLPRLRFLMCQDTVAGDEGFEALSRSPSIEGIWGRRCYNLRSRGFRALAAMPRLRALSVSCKNVDDEGLSALPRFPALTELMPMDVPDEGYRHVGGCERLESLVLMYCRDTTDAATEQIAGLRRLKSYHASYTRITDRSMEILAGMPSLERVSFYGCPGVTNVGVAALTRLPRLREVDISGPNITREGLAVFPAHVRVEHPV